MNQLAVPTILYGKVEEKDSTLMITFSFRKSYECEIVGHGFIIFPMLIDNMPNKFKHVRSINNVSVYNSIYNYCNKKIVEGI